MKLVVYLVEASLVFVRSLRPRPLRWYLLLLCLMVAGPLAMDLLFLVDLVAVVGIDVLVLSMLYYVSSSLSEICRTLLDRVARFIACQGGVPLRKECLESPASLALYLGHNLSVLVTPTRFVALALLCLGASPVAAWFGASHAS